MTAYKVLSIDYYDEFKCIGSKCEDNCCKEWSITVDKKTYNKYKKLQTSKFSKKLNDNINRNRRSKHDLDYAKINLVDKKCPMFSKDGLCEVYLNLGEEYMCHTCQIYPRIYNQVDNILEQSLTISCIEVARNLLLRENPIEFNLEIKDLEKEIRILKSINTTKGNNISKLYFNEIREFAISIIQDRRFSIENRLAILGLLINKISNTSKEENTVVKTIEEYRRNIEQGYYNNLIHSLVKEDNFDAQLEFLISIYKEMLNKKVNNERYINNYKNIIDSLQLSCENTENIKTSYANALSNNYRNFMSDYEHIYENYLVVYMFKNMFPYSEKSLLDTYINLVVQFSILKMNLIGVCGYYKENMDTEKILNLIQSYSSVTEHDPFLVNKIHNHMKENNRNTLPHALILMGK